MGARLPEGKALRVRLHRAWCARCSVNVCGPNGDEACSRVFFNTEAGEVFPYSPPKFLDRGTSRVLGGV